MPPRGEPGEPQRWQPLQLEGRQATPFTLDEDEEEALLLPAAAAAAPPAAAAAPGGSSKGARRLSKAVSRVQLASEAEEDSWPSYRHEAWRITQLALPLAVSQFFTFALGLISVAFVGRLGEQEMAVAVLATSFSNVSGFSVVLGLLGALDTLCGQAWGAKNYPALGLSLQKAVVTTAATCAVIGLLWAHTEGLMRGLGQDPAIAAGAARFLLLSIPALLCAGIFECLKRYLMAQGVVQPVTAISAAAVALAPLNNWLLVFKLHMGLDGAVYAMVATWLAMLCMLGAYVARHERRRHGTPEQTWHGWSPECLKGLGSYYRLAVPSTLMVCLEWWAYEFTIFIAGWLDSPTLHVASQGTMMQVSGFAYMLPMGLSCAVSVRVSNALGANLPHAAQRSARTATTMTLCTQASLAAVLLLARSHLARAFTDLPEVVATCAASFPILAGCMFGDGLNATVGGVLRGAGRQGLGALLNLGSYWGIGLPAAYLLAVKAGWGMQGLWAGLALCTSAQGLIMLAVLLRFNWQREAERAAELLAATGCASGDSCSLPACEDSAARLYPSGPSGATDGMDAVGSSGRGRKDLERQ